MAIKVMQVSNLEKRFCHVAARRKLPNSAFALLSVIYAHNFDQADTGNALFSEGVPQ
ncbi:hypothetical protein HYPGJ_20986 [Hyphomicrobium sp. GJ21]|nr:hypothetical protein [Hyphomicrobium denitrificans]CEJ85425.1 hypothetical protein HYPGJ_20986 [Hyphomicrobium sp. GJ21]